MTDPRLTKNMQRAATVVVRLSEAGGEASIDELVGDGESRHGVVRAVTLARNVCLVRPASKGRWTLTDMGHRAVGKIERWQG